MIDFLRGRLAHREEDYIVLDVNGVGYRVFCPNPYAFGDDQEHTVFIHHNVREDAVMLFGFQTREEQRLFRRLLEVSGIGPKVAIGALSAGRPEQIIAAIRQENLTFLTKLPGIGKKTAQRIVLDLKDKLAGEGIGRSLAGVELPDAVGFDGSFASDGSAWSEAKQGLLALGYTETEADRAWSQLKAEHKPEDTVDVLMKRALKVLYNGGR